MVDSVILPDLCLREADKDSYWMQHALLLAEKAQTQGEVPIGAVVVLNNEIIGEGWNQAIALHDPSAHAEIMALRAAGQKLQNYRLNQAILYVSLEPCTMCVGAVIQARIKRLVFAALDPKAGAVASHLHLLDSLKFNHRLAWEGGCLADPASLLLKNFFIAKR